MKQETKALSAEPLQCEDNDGCQTALTTSVWKLIFNLCILNIFKENHEGNRLQKGHTSTFLHLAHKWEGFAAWFLGTLQHTETCMGHFKNYTTLSEATLAGACP